MIIKPVTDKNDYLSNVLDNGVRLVAIHNPNISTSSISVNVGAGSMQDPKDMQGLAHFLEHMLFMGSEKYPSENLFSDFIDRNNGIKNAYTDQENTNYYLTIDTEAFEKALDMLAQFFKSPLISEDSLEREINAVNSEHIKNIPNDGWRSYLIFKELAEDGAEISKYGCGTKESISDNYPKFKDMREKLFEFYNSYYTPENISVVTMSNLPVKRQMELLRDSFSDIESRKTKKIKDYIYPFNRSEDPDVFCRYVDIKTKRESDRLDLDFIIPKELYNYRYDLLNFISDMIGDETENSLAKEMLDRDLISDLYVSCSYEDRSIVVLSVSIGLTDKGLNSKGTVTRNVFSYVEILKSMTKDRFKQLYEEFAMVNRINYDYKHTDNETDYVSTVSCNIMLYDLDHCLFGYKKQLQFSEDVYEQYINIVNCLTPDRTLLKFSAKNIDTDRTERWLGGEYRTKIVSLKDLESEEEYDMSLKLPKKNPYVPNNLKLSDEKMDSCIELYPNVYYRNISEFEKPRTAIDTFFFSDVLDKETVAKLNIYLSCKNFDLSKRFYGAQRVGYSLALSNYGVGDTVMNYFKIGVEGFSDKITKLNEDIIDSLYEEDFTENIFNNVKQQILKAMRNSRQSTPVKWGIDSFKKRVMENYYHLFEFEDIVIDTDYNECIKVFRDVIKNCVTKTVYEGNVFREDVSDRLSHTDKFPKNLSKVKELKKDISVDMLESVSQEDGLIYLYQLGGINTEEDYVEKISFVKLLTLCLADSFFNKVRTENRIGYIAFNSNVNYGTLEDKRVCYLFATQSGVKDIEFMSRVFDEYVSEMVEICEKCRDDFDVIKHTVVRELEQPKKTVFEYIIDDENEIIGLRPKDYIKKLTQKIKDTTFDDIINRVKDLSDPVKIRIKKLIE